MREANPFIFTPGIVRGLRPLPPAAEEEGVPGVPSFPTPGGWGIPSIYLDALRPQAPLIILQEQVARGDGTTTLFTTANAYVTGFLEVFLNGVKQRKTTHYTETSPAAGTFTFVQAPKNNDYIDVIYGTLTFGDYCGLTFCDDTAFPGGSVTPASSGYGPFFPKGSGARVFLAGDNNATQNPYVVWTDDIYASSPTYTANVSGLPQPGDGSYFVRSMALDPFDTNIIYLVISKGYASTGDELWKNTNIRGAGSWTKIYDLATHNTLCGTTETTLRIGGRYSTSDRPGWIETTIVLEGKIAFIADGNGLGNYHFIYSTNRGTSWSKTALLAGMGEGAMVLSQHNANRVHIYERAGASSGLYRSADGGATFSFVVHPDPPEGGVSGSLYHPYGASTDTNDMLVWFSFQGAPTSPLRTSSDNGTTWADGATSPFFRDAPWELTTLAASGLGYGAVLTGSSTKPKSTDGGASWANSSDTTRAVDHLALLRPTYGFWCGGDNGNEVGISPDWVTFTSKVGNLHSVEGANPGVVAVVPDWNSA